jgi:class 3 adenylate cyclase
MDRPGTSYARSGDVSIAYQVFGEGELDLVHVPGFVNQVEMVWEYEPSRRWLERLASFSRVITLDRRGTGLSDPVSGTPTLDERMDDLRAVMDAAGSQRAALMGISEGVPLCLLFAATYPERVQAVVCYGGAPRSTWAEDYPWAVPAEALTESAAAFLFPSWGDGSVIEITAPSQADNPEARAFMGRLTRATASPGTIVKLSQAFMDTDVRDIVPSVHVPALVLHRRHDRLVNVRNGRWLAEHLPDARLVELVGDDHNGWYETPEVTLGEVEEFLTGTRAIAEPERVLATVLFTDIVDSTRTATELGDRRWRAVLEAHQREVRAALGRHGGREVKSTGDGFLATFQGPARAIGCAREILSAAEPLGIRVRAGLHTGECEVMDDDIGGIAVHIAARVSGNAGPGEVVVSRTVKDLVAGSGIVFEDRGEHTLKGVPEAWRLFAVAPG